MKQKIGEAKIETEQGVDGRWKADVFQTNRRREIGYIGGVNGYPSQQEAIDAATLLIESHFSKKH